MWNDHRISEYYKNAENKDEAVTNLVQLTGRTRASIIAKLAAFGLRTGRSKRPSKVTGGDPITKIEIRREIEVLLEMELPQLEKAPKMTLLALRNKLRK